MTGKEIANNLRNSTKRWGKAFLMSRNSEGEPYYCVIGLKCHEAGIEDSRIYRKTGDANMYGLNLKTLYQLNDAASSKEALIGLLEGVLWRDFNFDIEAFIERLKGQAPLP